MQMIADNCRTVRIIMSLKLCLHFIAAAPCFLQTTVPFSFAARLRLSERSSKTLTYVAEHMPNLPIAYKPRNWSPSASGRPDTRAFCPTLC